MGSATCSTCRFWQCDPIDPMDLTALPKGECGFGPPVPVGVATAHGLQVIVLRPKVPSSFPACGQFAAALTVPGG